MAVNSSRSALDFSTYLPVTSYKRWRGEARVDRQKGRS